MKHFFCGLVLFYCISARAQDLELIDRTFTGQSSMKTAPEARRDIQDQAAKQMSEEAIRNLIGNEKFQKMNAQVQRILKIWPRYIPLMKQIEFSALPTADGFSGSVSLKMNPQILRQILQEQGLLDETHVQPIILPLLAIEDNVSQVSDQWWLPTENGNPFMKNLQREFEQTMSEAFRRQGFYLLKPLEDRMANNLPSPLKVANPSVEDVVLFGDWFATPLVLVGRLTLSPSSRGDGQYHLQFRAVIRQGGQSRELVDLVRHTETDIGKFESVVQKKWSTVLSDYADDLASQLDEASKKGQVGSRQLRLTIMVPLPLKDIEKIKEKLRQGSAGIRLVSERLISANSVTFEVEVPFEAKELADRLGVFEFQNLKLHAEAINASEVRMSQ